VSLQLGKWHFDGRPVSPDDPIRKFTLPDLPGHQVTSSYQRGNIFLACKASRTTREADRERQPLILSSGVVVTWDGCLYERDQLLDKLNKPEWINESDLELVAAAYARWGTECFVSLIGDWALVIWDPNERKLLLAKDHIGSRPLYYSVSESSVTWSTLLDPLVQQLDGEVRLDEEYLAGWLVNSAAVNLSPYKGICSASPCHNISIQSDRVTITKYWDFSPRKQIVYSRDSDYEEHFRHVFSEAVRKRLRSSYPILAELSGGMDSTAIVCVADDLIKAGAVNDCRLDTVSYYDDSEPAWNERPYFAAVEDRRGRVGTHLAALTSDVCASIFHIEFMPLPGSHGHCLELFMRLAACMHANNNRVLLSGFGGDEIMGGVPTPLPEIADLIANGRLRSLARQLEVWALTKRTPWFFLLCDALRYFFPSRYHDFSRFARHATWFDNSFVRRRRRPLMAYQRRVSVFGGRPSFQMNVDTLDGLRRQLGCAPVLANAFWEKRYPYLDLDLLEFMYAIPRAQVVRPGQRRSLMRRSLEGIVPTLVLERKRKAFISHGLYAALADRSPEFMKLADHMRSAELGIVNARNFEEAVRKGSRGKEVNFSVFIRTCVLESWLRGFAANRLAIAA